MGWLGPRCSITTESDGRVGCSPPLLILSENYRYVLLNHERYCEHFLEIMLHVFIDILCFCVTLPGGVLFSTFPSRSQARIKEEGWRLVPAGRKNSRQTYD